MPTFRNWKTESGYGIVANLPDAPHPYTYQLKPRAVEFYKQLDYENYDSIDGRLVWPLRKLGDVYIRGEDDSSDDETNELPTLNDLDKFSFTDFEKRALAQYVRNHPRFTEDIRHELNERLFDSEFEFLEAGKESSNTTSDLSNSYSKNESDLPSDVNEYLDNQEIKTTYDPIEYRGSNVNEYLQTISQIPCVSDSIREFMNHPYKISSISVSDIYLSYTVNIDHWPNLEVEVSDRRFDQSRTDFEVEFYIVNSRLEQCYTDTAYITKIIEGYITEWEMYADHGGKIEREDLSPSDYHNMVYEQSMVFEETISLFNHFGNYEIADPS